MTSEFDLMLLEHSARICAGRDATSRTGNGAPFRARPWGADFSAWCVVNINSTEPNHAKAVVPTHDEALALCRRANIIYRRTRRTHSRTY